MAADGAERKRRRDELAWAAVGEQIEQGAWRRVDRAVAEVLALARDRGLLATTWKVYLVDDDDRSQSRPYVTIDPAGQWELAEEARSGDVTSHAASDRPGVYTTRNALALRVSYVLKHAFDD